MALNKGTIRFHKARYSSQDVRNKALEARDELVAQVEFLTEAIREDRHKLLIYKEKFGDLQYRPLIAPGTDSKEPTYGQPTGVAIEPLASQYRATINSFLQSIRLIQSEIIAEDDPEGTSTSSTDASSTSKSASLREAFLNDNPQYSTPSPIEADNEELPTKLVEKLKSPSKAPNKPTTQSNLPPESESKGGSIQRPWRETTPRAQSKFVPKSSMIVPDNSMIVPDKSTETSPAINTDKPNNNPTEVGLSPALRLQLRGGSRLDSIRDKYRDGESRVVGKSEVNEESEE